MVNMLTYFLFIVGFGLLIKGADWLVAGAASFAKRLHISALVIGLTIVAFGTSTPELIVSILSSIQGNTDIAIGNIVGSNIANILLILGVSAIITPLIVSRGTTWREIPLSLIAVVAVWLMASDAVLSGRVFNEIDRIDGLVLLLFFIIFLAYVWAIAKQGKEQGAEVKLYPRLQSIGFMSGGFVALVLGGKWVVDGAVAIAQSLGASEVLIGLTIVAVGTSLPELATSVVAAYRGQADIAIGNVVGSNIFNIFWILGASAAINPLPFKPQYGFDLAVCTLATLLLFAAMFLGKRHMLERWQGILFVIVYVGYVTLLIVRG